MKEFFTLFLITLVAINNDVTAQETNSVIITFQAQDYDTTRLSRGEIKQLLSSGKIHAIQGHKILTRWFAEGKPTSKRIYNARRNTSFLNAGQEIIKTTRKDLENQAPYFTNVKLIDSSEQIIIAGIPCRKYKALYGQKYPIEVFATTIFGIDFPEYSLDIPGVIMKYTEWDAERGAITYQAHKIERAHLKKKLFTLDNLPIVPWEKYQKRYKKASLQNRKEQSRISRKKVNPFSDLSTIEGKLLKQDFFKGKVLVLNFWFKECKPCRREIPMLDSIAQVYKENEDIVFLSFALYKPQTLIKLFEQNNLRFSYHIIPEGKIFAEKFAVQYFPTNIVVNPDLTIQMLESGYTHDLKEKLLLAIENALTL